jgi:NAD(P)-dependent dehydrogenase (short-subunit alcohol dehydrogenase family)
MSHAVIDLSGKIVVVTGGLGVLGQAIAAVAAESAAKVARVDYANAEAPDPTASLQTGVDLADFAAADRVFARIADELGTIDALINVAGGFAWSRVVDSEPAFWEQLYRSNVLATVGACKAAIPRMRDGGAIVNVAAAATTKAAAGMGAYTAAKSGVLRLTEALAEELRPRGIRVNAVSPTTIDTPRNRADMPDADTSRWIPPQTLARIMLFLAFDDAHFVNGANVLVGG